MVEKFPNFWQNLSTFVRGWQLVAVGVTWPFWIMWHQLEDDSWEVQAGVPVQSRPPLVDSDGLLDSPPGHTACIVMFTHGCSSASACGVFFVSCPQASTRFPNVCFVTVVTFSVGIPPPIVVPGVFCPSVSLVSLSISLGLFVHVVDLWYVGTQCFLKIRWSCSDRPCMYGMATLDRHSVHTYRHCLYLFKWTK